MEGTIANAFMLSSSPRITSLASSNEVPSESDHEATSNLISQAEAHLVSVESRIRELETEPSELEQQRTCLQSALQSWRRILSPWRRLPADVLHEVFLCLAEYDESTSSFLGQGIEWKVARVCTSWRDCALTCSRLWTLLRVNLQNFERRLRLIWLQIERSGSRPLSVYLSCGIPLRTNHPALALILSTSNRWQTLTLHLPNQSIHQLHPIRGHLGSLKRLHVYDSQTEFDAFMPSANPATLSMFEDAPRLTELRGSPRILLSLLLPWEQIIDYRAMIPHQQMGIARLCDYRARLSIELLSRATRLQSADVYLNCEEPLIVIGQIPLPLLTSLTIDLKFSQRVPDMLFLPALQTLHFQPPFWNLATLGEITQFLRRLGPSECQLKCLSIRLASEAYFHPRHYNHVEMFQLLAVVPKLAELTISWPTVKTRVTFFQKWLELPPSTPLLPELRRGRFPSPSPIVEPVLLRKLRNLRPELRLDFSSTMDVVEPHWAR